MAIKWLYHPSVKSPEMNVCIIGLGLLGGSAAQVLKAKVPRVRIIGVDQSREHAAQALTLGIADKVLPMDLGVSQADLVILATPVSSIANLLLPVLDRLPERAVVMDVGSTKEHICRVADQHARRGRFVAAHPIAGTERSGPTAAFGELLPGKPMILCNTEHSDHDARERVENLFMRRVGMAFHYMSAADHDQHLAYVSHLSHVSSFALSTTVLAKEPDEANLFALAGSGFSSTVRLAKSSPAMWTPIFVQNRANVREALAAYIKNLERFQEILEQDDELASYQWMQRANEIRRVLSGVRPVEG